MDANKTNIIQEFVDDAISQAVAGVERKHANTIKALEAAIPQGNEAWAAYEKLASALATEKGDVARAAFLAGLGYGIAMAHISNPSLFTQKPGIPE